MRFVHIAGTNGKGSAATYISSIITAAGKRCGCFTSPHLISPAERFKIDGRCIDAQTLSALVQEVEENGLAVNDTLFAAYTAAALLWFERENVQWAVMETGLGGRLDPTNSVVPDAVVLTPISVDHTDVLGSRIEDIAAEKCGIIKPNIPVISAVQEPVVRDIIVRRCAAAGSPLYFADDVTIITQLLDGQVFETDGRRYTVKSIGTAQAQNAAQAAMTCRLLGFDEAAICAGLESALLVARTQYIPGRPDILLDGAHNPAAAAVLTGTIDHFFSDRRKVLLFACMRNKDYCGIIDAIGARFDHVIATSVDLERGADASVLCACFSDDIPCEACSNFDAAYDRAMAEAVKKDALLVVCGSFYLAGAVWHRLQSEK